MRIVFEGLRIASGSLCADLGVAPDGDLILTTDVGRAVMLEHGVLAFKTAVTPASAAEIGKIYVKSDNQLYYLDPTGRECVLADAGHRHEAAVWHVDAADGDDQFGDGSADAPWAGIGKALAEAALTLSWGVPVTIYLGRGEYVLDADTAPLPRDLTLIGVEPVVTSVTSVTQMGDPGPGGLPLDILCDAAVPSWALDVALFSAVGGVAPDALNGAYAILASIVGGAAIASGETDPARLPSGAVAAVARLYGSRLNITANAGLTGETLALHHLTLVGPAGGPALTGRQLMLRDVAIRDCGGVGLTCLSGGRLDAEWLAVSRCVAGLLCQAGSTGDGAHVAVSRMSGAPALTCARAVALNLPGVSIYGCPEGINADMGAMVDIFQGRIATVPTVGIRAAWLSVVKFEQGVSLDTPTAIIADHLAVVGIAGATISGSITPPVSAQPFAFVTDES